MDKRLEPYTECLINKSSPRTRWQAPWPSGGREWTNWSRGISRRPHRCQKGRPHRVDDRPPGVRITDIFRATFNEIHL